MQDELPPTKRKRVDAPGLGGRGAAPGDAADKRPHASLAAAKQRLAPRPPPAKPRTGSHRAKPSARSASRLDSDSTLGSVYSLLRRIDDLHSRMLPLVRQAQESVTGQLRAGRSADVGAPLSDGHVLLRQQLLAQLETLAHMPRLRRAMQLPVAAVNEVFEPLDELDAPQLLSDAAPLGAVAAEAPPPPEVDTSATDVDDDE